MGLFRSLRHRTLALLLVSQTGSKLGDWVHRIALQWWVLQNTEGAVALSTMFSVMSISMVAFLMVGGVTVDRMSRTSVMLVSDSARFVLTGVLAWLVYSDRFSIELVYGLAFLWGFVDAFFQPAYEALVQEITPADDLTSANGLAAIARQVTGIAGPAVGALFISQGHLALAFAFDSLTFLASGLALLAIGKTPTPAPSEGGGPASVIRDLRDGLGTVLASPFLWITMLATGLLQSLDYGVYDMALPYLIVDVRKMSVGDLATVQVVTTIGAVVTSIWLGRQASHRRRGIVFYAAGLVLALSIIGLGFVTTTVMLSVIAFIRGAATNVVFLTWLGSLQTVVPNEKFGRVMSLDMLNVCLLSTGSYMGVGWAISHADPVVVLGIGGGLVAVYLLTALLHPKVRSFD